MSLNPSLVLVTAPTTPELVTVEQAKLWCRVDFDDEDALFDDAITAARQKLEDDTRLKFGAQVLDLTVDLFPLACEALSLLTGPVTLVTSVTSYASDDTATTFSSASYFLDSARLPARVCLNQGQTWPTDLRSRVAGVVRFTAGYTASTAPKRLLLALRMMVEGFYRRTWAEDDEAAYQRLIAAHVLHFVGEE